jgi:hypothetical protein
MSTSAEDLPAESEARKKIEGMEQQLVQAEEELKRLDEEILEARRKSKEVIVHPEQ